MRTLPDAHEQRVKEMSKLILGTRWEAGTTVRLEVLKDAEGSLTPEDSPIVKIAEAATGRTARGFNGGDEGRIMRLMAQKEGVTLGPGELCFAHMPDEQVNIQSIFDVAKIYSTLFRKSVGLNLP
jgi:acetylornithine deacetylase/succinyl-diaminopimelate desuccinylase-like protein